MISPLRRGDLYPGRLPPVRQQWARMGRGAKVALIAIPLAVAGLVTVVDVRAGVTVAVLLLGLGAATAVYIKNRTDRHNAAVDRGEIAVVADPHFRATAVDDVPAEMLAKADGIGRDPADIGRVVRFDGGWIVGRRNRQDVAVVIGDDGGWARFDPRTVTDLWAVGEYLAGRGRDG
ncbi:MAG TPA: hypothetical protein VKI19_06495 [Acidimicrobiales bacterium]|nr:hypothetical protein [Acidimicrobiales bacterium]